MSADRLELLLFSNDVELAQAAARAGVDGIVIDWENKGKHERQPMVRAFEAYDKVTLVAGWYRLIDAAGQALKLRRLEVDRPVVSTPGGAGGHILVSARNPIGPLTTFMFRRRSLPLGIGPYFFATGAPERYFGLIDMTIVLDLAFSGRVVTLPEPLSAMRVHPDQLSNPAHNPHAVYSIRSWLPLAEDAHAFGLIDARQHLDALETILGQFGRFVGTFPELRDDIAALEERLATLRGP